MKALLLSATILIGGFVSAQDTLSKLAIETHHFLGQQNDYTPNLRLRYMVNQKGALRLNLQYAYNSVTTEIYELNGNGVGTIEDLNNDLQLAVGYEKFFTKEKFRSYVGGGLVGGSGKDETYGSRTDSTSFVADFNYTSKSPYTSIGVQLFSGVDFFISDGLYVGTELGFTYLKKIVKKGQYRAEDGSSSTASIVEVDIPAVTTKSLDLTGLGMIRLGWRF